MALLKFLFLNYNLNQDNSEKQISSIKVLLAPFGWADKPAEKHCWLIRCEIKILFRLKKQAEKDGL
jgi:hypothetical protein